MQRLPLHKRPAPSGSPHPDNGANPGIASRLPGTGNARPSAALSLLASLPYSEFAAIVARVLEALGYRDVGFTLLKKQLGKNRGGGIDLVATPPDGGNRKDEDRLHRTAVVQLRQFRPGEAVQQRAVDEVRGACLRAGAQEALLVTTGRFSPLARQNALRSQRSGIAPVYLLDGEALASACVSAYEPARSDAARQTGEGSDGSASTTGDAARTTHRRSRARPAVAPPRHGGGRAGRCTYPARMAGAADTAVIVSVRVSVRPG